MDPKENLTSGEKRGIIPVGEKPENLDNGIRALPTVQTPIITTANGCQLKLYFKSESDPRIRKEIARMLHGSVGKEGKMGE